MFDVMSNPTTVEENPFSANATCSERHLGTIDFAGQYEFCSGAFIVYVCYENQ